MDPEFLHPQGWRKIGHFAQSSRMETIAHFFLILINYVVWTGSGKILHPEDEDADFFCILWLGVDTP